LLDRFDAGLRDRSGVFLQRVQEHHQVLRARGAGVAELSPELAQVAFDPRGDRGPAQVALRRLAVQVLLDEGVDLAARLGGRAWMNWSTGSTPRESR